MDERLFEGYESTKLVNCEDLSFREYELVKFSNLPEYEGDGVLKACFRGDDGELMQLYSKDGNHVGVIAATRLGKTTSYVIPTIISYATQKRKKSMIISDPKGELYRKTSGYLKKMGYDVKLLNFRDCEHTEYWNPLTPIFRKYRDMRGMCDRVRLVETSQDVFLHEFDGKIYDDEEELRSHITRMQKVRMCEVENEIDAVAEMYITTACTKDPTWEDGARSLLKAFLYAMLEDSDLEVNPIREETYSLETIFTIMDTFSDYGQGCPDMGYFSKRGPSSRAYSLACDIILSTSGPTASSYVSVFRSKLCAFTDAVTRKITSCNSFDIGTLADGGPVAVFLAYRDELKAQFETIALFVKEAYKALIESATKRPGGRLEIPFCFILDEFGNFPRIKDFETVITACGGRNIWFTLIMQSYAQLEAVYGDVATIIRDNLNVHVFMGSNNPATLEEFSRECGQYTRISPLSYMNGTGLEVEKYEMETIPLMTKSRLSHFAEGECTVTEANCGYVLLSKLERYFRCAELMPCEECSDEDYPSPLNPFDSKYTYRYFPPRDDVNLDEERAGY
ncbi:MAG: type IV secretory system conjugative DNA transfer family protein [Clostridia bacterium]|nr:type IV secretory system conjugative DNA transfer family protein [Clostridia bacterium]